MWSLRKEILLRDCGALPCRLSAVPVIGVAGIWAAIPIGWFLADAYGIVWYIAKEKDK